MRLRRLFLYNSFQWFTTRAREADQELALFTKLYCSGPPQRCPSGRNRRHAWAGAALIDRAPRSRCAIQRPRYRVGALGGLFETMPCSIRNRWSAGCYCTRDRWGGRTLLRAPRVHSFAARRAHHADADRNGSVADRQVTGRAYPWRVRESMLMRQFFPINRE